MTLLSDDGGKYMASEKQVSSNLSNSVLKNKEKNNQSVAPEDQQGWEPCLACTDTGASPVQVMDVVERGRLCEAHPGLPDVLAAVDGVHALH